MTGIPTEIGPTIPAVVKASERITPEHGEEVRHLILEVLDPDSQFVEGQSIGILPPESHACAPSHHLRRYSIANARPVPLGGGIILDILVRRCFGTDAVSGAQAPGVTSNFLCDAKPGDELTISGPYLNPFRMPLDNRANLLMIGAGTGISPFRTFVQHIYERRGDWKGQVRLYYGGPNGLDLLYINDQTADLADYYDDKTFRAFRALGSGLPTSHSDGPAEHVRDAWGLLNEPNTHVFLSGLNSVARGFEQVMAEQAGSPESWAQLKQRLIDEGRWSELTYD
jgi:ferredoxin--NADP+ reductase